MDWHAAALAFDLKRLDPAFLADPFPLYRALREHDPIHRMPDGSYFPSRYDDCAAVYRDAATAFAAFSAIRSGSRRTGSFELKPQPLARCAPSP